MKETVKKKPYENCYVPGFILVTFLKSLIFKSNDL